MSNYIFAPSPSFNVSEHPFVTYRNAFNEDELNKLIQYLDSLEKTKATIGNNNESENITQIRKSSVAWVSYNDDSRWLYDRMAFIARLLNGQFYKFDLYGFSEDMQYTIYNSEEQGHYTWHIDNGMSSNNAPRKFSMILQLSDPNEYEGGNLEVFTGMSPTQVDKEKGLIAAFPSYTLHRVTPVISGIRKTLVVWVCGPSFK